MKIGLKKTKNNLGFSAIPAVCSNRLRLPKLSPDFAARAF
jgi:hypothetical protein